jgi:thioredoxin reductase (NADPH)
MDGNDPALFPKHSDEQMDLLGRHGTVRPIQVGEVLFRDGDATYDVMALMSGRVSITVGRGETQRLLAVNGPRDLLVELNILTGQPVGAIGVVEEPGEMVVVPAKEFRRLLGCELVFGDFVLQTMFRRRKALEPLQMGIQIVGSPFDPDVQRLREFATRNRVLHEWLDNEDPRAHSLLAELGSGSSHSAIVVVGNRDFLHNLTNADLARAVGLHTIQPPSEKTYDVLVIGAGPSGLAAAVYGASGGLRTAILDAVAVGGQAATSARIENYLGFPAGLSGSELAERARIQAAKFGAHIMVTRHAIGLTERDGFHVLALDDGDEILAASVILALGVQYGSSPRRIRGARCCSC